MKNHILVVDDEPDIRSLVQEILEDEGYSVATAEDARVAQIRKQERQPDLVLLDIWMPETDGITLLKEWKEKQELVMPVVMMSGHGTVETAVEATRLGAYDFIEKPLSLAKLILTVEHALEANKLQQENIQLKSRVNPVAEPIGRSQLIQSIKQQIERIANHNTPVLFKGESGTDKEHYARYLHTLSDRSESAFITAGMSAISGPNALRDVFGFEEDGKAYPGILERADGGTLYLKDIEDMSTSLQAKMQTALEEQRMMRVNGKTYIDFDVRVISSCSVELEVLINEGKFRGDLYYQLSVVPLDIPALREHYEDIPELLEYYINHFTEFEGLPYRKFSVAAQNRLRSHDWPGNVRELKNLVQRLLILGNKEEIEVQEIERALGQYDHADAGNLFEQYFQMPIREAREEFERQYFQYQLEKNDGSVTQVSRTVGMERTHLYRKLKSLGIDIKS